MEFRSFIFGGLAWFTVPIVTGAVALLALARDFDIPQVNMVFPIVTAKLLGSGGAMMVFIFNFRVSHLHAGSLAGLHG